MKTITRNFGFASALIIGSLMLAACSSTDVAKYAEIDASDKTVTTPAGNRGLLGRLKRGFSERGWRFTFDRGPDRSVGTVSGNVDVESFNTFRTRYRLYVEWSQFDYCLNLEPIVTYDIVLIDNQTGSEVVSLSGKECENDAARKFFEAIDD